MLKGTPEFGVTAVRFQGLEVILCYPNVWKMWGVVFTPQEVNCGGHVFTE